MYVCNIYFSCIFQNIDVKCRKTTLKYVYSVHVEKKYSVIKLDDLSKVKSSTKARSLPCHVKISV